MTARTPRPGRRAGLLRLLTVVVGVILALTAGAGRAAAEPSPAPSPPVPSAPQPTGSPTAPAVPAPSASDIPGCGGTVPGTVQRWCFLWVRYTTSPPQGAPSHWITACAQALTTEQLQQCQTVALTLDDRPGDGTPTVLSDVAPGIPSAPDLVRCDLFAERGIADPGNANRWIYKRDQCRIWAASLSYQLRDPSSTPPSTPPADGGRDCGLTDVSCQVANILDNAISNGVQGLVNMTVKCMAWLLGEVAKVVFDVTAPPPPDAAFYFTYNSAASILLLFVLLFFIVTVIINGLRVNGPGPLATLGGLVRAMLGILFAGGLAWVIVAAWDDATRSLINANSNQRWDAALWVKAVSALSVGGGTMLLALLIAGLSIIGLLLLLITQLFRSELAEGAAILGAFAMTGQIAPETKHWARRWFWTLNALGMSRFVTVELWIYGTRSAYQSDLITAGKGLLIIWMMVLTPWVLLRLLTIVDGYLSDINARGVMAAFSAQTAQGVNNAAAGSPSSGSPGEQAAHLMHGNLADLRGEQSGLSSAASASGRGGVGNAQPQRELTGGPNAQAADAVSGSGDATAAGDPHGDGGPASGGSDGAPDGGGAEHPNADEAAGVQQHTAQAKADLNATTTTSSTGGAGGQPSGTAGAAADGGHPVPGAGSGGGDGGGGAASGVAGSTDADPLIAAAGAEHQPAGEPMPPSDHAPPPDPSIPGADHGGAPAEPGGARDSPPGGDPPSAPAGGGTGSGSGVAGGGGAAAGAAEVPIVPA
ncbi:hypothetical protein [Dactylosporangium sp. CA-139066]|uniref:hypothetical protein n=1 Tax=Dactylosporangium sp. CA-139066 TaxID=3239930 RepID=UPI003D8B1A05